MNRRPEPDLFSMFKNDPAHLLREVESCCFSLFFRPWSHLFFGRRGARNVIMLMTFPFLFFFFPLFKEKGKLPSPPPFRVDRCTLDFPLASRLGPLVEEGFSSLLSFPPFFPRIMARTRFPFLANRATYPDPSLESFFRRAGKAAFPLFFSLQGVRVRVVDLFLFFSPSSFIQIDRKIPFALFRVDRDS